MAAGSIAAAICQIPAGLLVDSELAARVAIDHLVLDAAKRQIRSAVICPCLIYGTGKGLHADSIQVPCLIATAKKGGVGRYIGRGLNVWSTVFIDDVVDLFVLALEKAAAGSFFFAESGEASMKSLVEQISRALGFGGRTQSWPLEEAVQEWGSGMARFGLGSNSRVRGLWGRQILGWKPSEQSLENYLKTIS